jgi:hypothetical protein
MKRLALHFVDRLSRRIWKNGPLADIEQTAILIAGFESARYYTKYMLHCESFHSALELLTYATSKISIPGMICEFGVASGTTINHLARSLPGRQIHGFDSFAGLPINWRTGFPKGAFAQPVPVVEPNVSLHIGSFAETLPKFVSSFQDDAALLHIDCDLYTSTKEIFATLGDRIKPGTVIVFDEYMNYPGWRLHEWKAFREFIAQSGLRYEYIGLVPSHQQVAVKIQPE